MQTRSGRLLAKPIAWPTGAVTTQGEQLPDIKRSEQRIAGYGIVMWLCPVQDRC
jgi:hypothetical protein